jgi:cell wall-associated NlpC family hydrolase
MTSHQAVVVARAQAAVGVRFRLHGRDPATGLDCLGLASWALWAGNPPIALPTGYGLHSGRADQFVAWLAAAGLQRADGQKTCPGDLLLVQPSPMQWHCLIAAERGFVHAHAGLRRVVQVSTRENWPLVLTARLLA